MIVIFAHGEIEDYRFVRSYLDNISLDTVRRPVVICCDGGLRHADAMGIIPDCCIGDFDSAAQSLMDRYREQGVVFFVYPKAKDQTDLELAIRYALENMGESDDQEPDGSAREILIFGGLGGRLDHTVTNVQVLRQAAAKGVPARLVDEYVIVTLLCDEMNEIAIEGCGGDLVSLIPLSLEVTGVETEGLLYPLKKETLYLGYGRGLSNVLAGKQAAVAIEKGVLMVIQNTHRIEGLRVDHKA